MSCRSTGARNARVQAIPHVAMRARLDDLDGLLLGHQALAPQRRTGA